MPLERVRLRDAAGRTLRQDVQAERDNPPFDRVCMDGIAVASTAFDGGARSFRIQGTQAAGAVPMTLAEAGAAIEVMTGAVLPAGTDSVIVATADHGFVDVAPEESLELPAPFLSQLRFPL